MCSVPTQQQGGRCHTCCMTKQHYACCSIADIRAPPRCWCPSVSTRQQTPCLSAYSQVFLKASWHVGEPFVERYSAWALAQVRSSLLSSWFHAAATGRHVTRARLPHCTMVSGEKQEGAVGLPCCILQTPLPLCLVPKPMQASGRDTTGGSFDEAMYRYAISPGAQESHRVEDCYRVLQGA